MAFINFVIPETLDELLVDTGERYFVKELMDISEIKPKLEGPS